METILLKEAIIMANSNNMCRLCLSANGITEPICYDQRDQFLLQKIYECTTLQIAPLNGIPSSLCTICKARLDEFYQFRWQCIKNDEIIRRIADNFHKQSNDPAASHNGPKQEVIDTLPSGEMQAQPPTDSSSEYTPQGERRPNERHTPVNFQQHSDPMTHGRPEQINYGAATEQHGHNQYNIGNTSSPNIGAMGAEHSAGFPPDTKYPMPLTVAHQFDFTDFRRKRGRPPKQKYDQYHNPVVKYDGSSIEDIKGHATNDGGSSSSTGVDEPETILTFGDDHGRTNGYQQESAYGGWTPPAKIKLEQIDHQQVRYDEQHHPSSPEQHHPKRDAYMKLPSTSTVQTILTPDGFVKRSRGRPPREGGCPNQDRTEYRFQCQYCDARFKAAINLKLHTNTHTGERPYKCQLCDKSFAHPSNLSVHTKLHSQERIKREGIPSEKKFQCPYCNTLFALAFQLKIHINTHTGQKPYICKNCGKGFAQPSNLHVHVKKHCHKKVDYEGHRTNASQQNPLAPPADLQQHPHYQSAAQIQELPPPPPPPPPPHLRHSPPQQPTESSGHHETTHHHSPSANSAQLSMPPPVMLV